MERYRVEEKFILLIHLSDHFVPSFITCRQCNCTRLFRHLWRSKWRRATSSRGHLSIVRRSDLFHSFDPSPSIYSIATLLYSIIDHLQPVVPYSMNLVSVSLHLLLPSCNIYIIIQYNLIVYNLKLVSVTETRKNSKQSLWLAIRNRVLHLTFTNFFERANASGEILKILEKYS